MRLRHG